ncbi:MAG: SDR family oxidoreductase [Planctomycetes bacterium]|nr:SDR family oxidoreductase [Planctomycetota bacterium]
MARQKAATKKSASKKQNSAKPQKAAPRAVRKQPKPPFPEQGISPPGEEAKMDPRPRYEAPAYRAAAKLQGMVALVTGGDSGIGRSAAVLFAREGAYVALVHLPEEQKDADETLRAIGAEGTEGISIPGDVSDPKFCKKAVEKTLKKFGRLDILVNNAAYQQHRESVEEVDIEQWDRTFKTNIYGYFYMVKAALPHLPEGGAIINTSSITGLEGNKSLIDYSSTKGAINAFTKSLAQSLAERRIRVNAVAPGPVWTPLNPAERSPEEMQEFGAGTPYGRPAEPEEVAPAFVFFASAADSHYVTGQVLGVLGGETTAG